MATPHTYQNPVIPLRVVETKKTQHIGLNKLFEAAIVNRKFCQLLLSHPQAALQQGYLGNAFDLTLEEQTVIMSTRANSLPDLAQKVTRALD